SLKYDGYKVALVCAIGMFSRSQPVFKPVNSIDKCSRNCSFSQLNRAASPFGKGIVSSKIVLHADCTGLSGTNEHSSSTLEVGSGEPVRCTLGWKMRMGLAVMPLAIQNDNKIVRKRVA
ncbi:hypothetical protein, partial [Pectobacterium versatile]|uniref:hypothetical protein n=1 Tax=Pectobacterium versatile TaxID=2488639 RepID=UPI001CF2DC47